jgi:hypothetical protein
MTARDEALREIIETFVERDGITPPVKGAPTSDDVKVKLGAAVSDAIAASEAAGYTRAEAKASILDLLRDKGAASYTWATVQRWRLAAAVNASLAADIQVFGVDALAALAEVPEKDGRRQNFAADLVRQGVTTIRPVRKAVATEMHQPADPSAPADGIRPKDRPPTVLHLQAADQELLLRLQAQTGLPTAELIRLALERLDDDRDSKLREIADDLSAIAEELGKLAT